MQTVYKRNCLRIKPAEKHFSDLLPVLVSHFRILYRSDQMVTISTFKWIVHAAHLLHDTLRWYWGHFFFAFIIAKYVVCARLAILSRELLPYNALSQWINYKLCVVCKMNKELQQQPFDQIIQHEQRVHIVFVEPRNHIAIAGWNIEIVDCTKKN